MYILIYNNYTSGPCDTYELSSSESW